MRDPKAFQRDLVEFLGERAYERLRTITPSRRLRSTLNRQFDFGRRADGTLTVRLNYPEYWAVYLHDGRGPVSPRNAPKLIFFDNPDDDPRIRPTPSGYPTKESEVRRLSTAEYREGLRQNRIRRAQGARPYMYVLDAVGGAAGFKWLEEGSAGSPGMRGFLAQQSPAIVRRFRDYMRREVIVNESSTARLRL